MSNNELYRVKKGKLTSEDLVIPVIFGVVTSEDGVCEMDVYIEEDFDLNGLFEKKFSSVMEAKFILKSITENNNELEVDNLTILKFSPHLSKITMVCLGKLTHTKIPLLGQPVENNEKKKSLVFYLVLEGLKMNFADFTSTVKMREGKRIEEYPEMETDHSAVVLMLGKFPVKQVFYRDSETDNIIVEFDNSNWNKLFYPKYEEFKRDYISVLSLLNGAQVKIRKEFIGAYVSIYHKERLESETVITYSFNTIKNVRRSKYIPLADPFHKGNNIINDFFYSNFSAFQEWNERVDLSTIIFFLNNAEQANSMKGKFFIQMIAFERLTTMYADYLGSVEEFFPNKDEFAPIRDEMYEVLEKHKKAFGKYFLAAKSKLGNLNSVKRYSTTEKMYRILQDFDIPVGEKTKEIIEVVRHQAIHRGKISDEFQESVFYFKLLDELVREIILRMAGYQGLRNIKHIGK